MVLYVLPEEDSFLTLLYPELKVIEHNFFSVCSIKKRKTLDVLSLEGSDRPHALYAGNFRFDL